MTDRTIRELFCLQEGAAEINIKLEYGFITVTHTEANKTLMKFPAINKKQNDKEGIERKPYSRIIDFIREEKDLSDAMIKVSNSI